MFLQSLFLLCLSVKASAETIYILKYLFSQRQNCFLVLGNLLHKLIVFLYFFKKHIKLIYSAFGSIGGFMFMKAREKGKAGWKKTQTELV